MGSSIVPLSSASESPSSSSQSSRTSTSSRITSASSSSRAVQSYSESSSIYSGGSPSKPNSDRPTLSVQRLSASRVASSLVDKSNTQSNSTMDTDTAVRRQSTKKQQQQQQQQTTSKDPLYSLSSASIRARKNALEMENIQRASHLYADYIAKIKNLSLQSAIESEIANKIKSTYLSESDVVSLNNMDIDTEERMKDDQVKDMESAPAVAVGDSGSAKEAQPAAPSITVESRTSLGYGNKCNPIRGLETIAKSGLLHSLIQRYFTLIHPQFMILHKNHFLVRFWAQYGAFPEAKELHLPLIHRARAGNVWRGNVEPEQEDRGSEGGGSESINRSSALLIMAMLALVSRHINDRGPLKSTAQDKQWRLERSLDLMNPEFQTAERVSMCQEKVQEARLQDLMETDEQGQSETGEDLKDRGEQYFQWATELLKAEYEEPSLTVVQSLLLLREYAIMAGNHTQAYMYGGTAITMAMGLGWHHAHLVQTPNHEEKSILEEKAEGSAEDKAEKERQQENKAKDEEQKLCWWHCFIVDRWMSAAYNRPVNIPVHIFDKTHLRPLPKPKKLLQTKDGENRQATMSALTPEFWLAPGGPDTSVTTNSMNQNGGVTIPPIGSGVSPGASSNLPGAQFRAKTFFDQQCRQALLLDDILCFLSSWSEDLFVSSAEFEKLSGALDDWHRSLLDWQTFPLSGIVVTTPSQSRSKGHKSHGNGGRDQLGTSSTLTSSINADEGRDVVQSTLLGITFHAIRILLYRPFLRTNLRHPPCLPARASTACAQSANAMTSLAEYLMNQTDQTIQQSLLMRHQFALVTAAGIQLTNANLDDEPRLSTPAKINLLKTIRILRDADRSSWGVGVRDGFRQLLKELFPAQMKLMYDN
ncbi:hypothetical protein BGX27_002032 [Mortierella sp. AM989]|nr:hypothetical protein BGX27_002032 [Mortierella sp. AM989]